MLCPTCHKQLPEGDRFCAYCGSSLGRRLLPGLRLSLPAVSVRWLPIALAGGLLGGAGGALLGALFDGPWLGALFGALGLGASAALGELVAGAIPDRDSGGRFGQALGALGGGLVLPGGFLAALLITALSGSPQGSGDLAALLATGANRGLISSLVGALIGVAAGLLLGRLAGRGGYTLLRRRGAILGAALAWTLAAALGGFFAGDYAGRFAGAARVESAALGAGLQIIVAALLLIPIRRLHRRFGAWRRSRP